MYKILQFKEQVKLIKSSKSKSSKKNKKSTSKKSSSKKELFITNAKYLKKEYKTETKAAEAILKLQAEPSNNGFKFMVVEKKMPKQHVEGCRQGEENENALVRKVVPCTCAIIESNAKDKLSKVLSLIKELSTLSSELSVLPPAVLNKI